MYPDVIFTERYVTMVKAFKCQPLSITQLFDKNDFDYFEMKLNYINKLFMGYEFLMLFPCHALFKWEYKLVLIRQFF
jgi:hypothetical protein